MGDQVVAAFTLYPNGSLPGIGRAADLSQWLGIAGLIVFIGLALVVLFLALIGWAIARDEGYGFGYTLLMIVLVPIAMVFYLLIVFLEWLMPPERPVPSTTKSQPTQPEIEIEQLSDQYLKAVKELLMR